MSGSLLRFPFCVLLAAFWAPASFVAAENPPAPRDAAKAEVRTFRFTYAGVIDNVPSGKTARVWLPVATSNHAQRVQVRTLETPAGRRFTTEKRFGNKLLYFEAAADAQGQIPFEIVYHVERRELLRGAGEPVKPEQQEKFLAPSRMEPVDQGLLGQLLPQRSEKASLALALRLYNAVDNRMRYDKPPTGLWGRGDAVWACDAGYGNCTDFHSVFIAACREASIPARFEIGFSLPPRRGQGEIPGYHCWAFFANDGRWVPVDISEADKHPEMKAYYFGNLTADRIAFTVGRDLQLDPPPRQSPTNFLVYPYVEVDGRPHTSFVKKFAYEDLEGAFGVR